VICFLQYIPILCWSNWQPRTMRRTNKPIWREYAQTICICAVLIVKVRLMHMCVYYLIQWAFPREGVNSLSSFSRIFWPHVDGWGLNSENCVPPWFSLCVLIVSRCKDGYRNVGGNFDCVQIEWRRYNHFFLSLFKSMLDRLICMEYFCPVACLFVALFSVICLLIHIVTTGEKIINIISCCRSVSDAYFACLEPLAMPAHAPLLRCQSYIHFLKSMMIPWRVGLARVCRLMKHVALFALEYCYPPAIRMMV
jgi:hypothetical protein